MNERRHITTAGEQPLSGDILTPSEFLESRRDILEAVDAGLLDREEAAAAFEDLALTNPSMQATWANDVQRQM